MLTLPYDSSLKAHTRRLHFVHALFARVTGDDLYLVRQIQEAITFSLAELAEQTRAHPDFTTRYDTAFQEAAVRLLTSTFAARADHGFFHWNALGTQTSASPLFARAELMAGLKSLSPYREATLLVTNLRPAFLPPDSRKSQARLQAYAEALTFVRDLTTARSRPDANLQLLFV